MVSIYDERHSLPKNKALLLRFGNCKQFIPHAVSRHYSLRLRAVM